MHGADKRETKPKCGDNIEMCRKVEGCEGNIVPFHDIINVNHTTRNFLFISLKAADKGAS